MAGHSHIQCSRNHINSLRSNSVTYFNQDSTCSYTCSLNIILIIVLLIYSNYGRGCRFHRIGSTDSYVQDFFFTIAKLATDSLCHRRFTGIVRSRSDIFQADRYSRCLLFFNDSITGYDSIRIRQPCKYFPCFCCISNFRCAEIFPATVIDNHACSTSISFRIISYDSRNSLYNGNITSDRLNTCVIVITERNTSHIYRIFA